MGFYLDCVFRNWVHQNCSDFLGFLISNFVLSICLVSIQFGFFEFLEFDFRVYWFLDFRMWVFGLGNEN